MLQKIKIRILHMSALAMIKLKRKKNKLKLKKLFSALFESKLLVNTVNVSEKKSLGWGAVLFTIVSMSIWSNPIAANPACGTPTNHWLSWEGFVHNR